MISSSPSLTEDNSIKSNNDSVYTCSSEHGISLPAVGEYATGILFLAKDTNEQAEEAFTKLATECQLNVSWYYCY